MRKKTHFNLVKLINVIIKQFKISSVCTYIHEHESHGSETLNEFYIVTLRKDFENKRPLQIPFSLCLEVISEQNQKINLKLVVGAGGQDALPARAMAGSLKQQYTLTPLSLGSRQNKLLFIHFRVSFHFGALIRWRRPAGCVGEINTARAVRQPSLYQILDPFGNKTKIIRNAFTGGYLCTIQILSWLLLGFILSVDNIALSVRTLLLMRCFDSFSYSKPILFCLAPITS